MIASMGTGASRPVGPPTGTSVAPAATVAHECRVASANPVQELRGRGDNHPFVALGARGRGGEQRGDRHGGKGGRPADERVHDFWPPENQVIDALDNRV